MSFQYYGYSGMPATLYESFATEDLVRAKQQLKQYTDPYIPKITENKFIYTGTEKNQILNDRPILQRSLIEDFQMPVFEYIGRVKYIEPRPNYTLNVDMSTSFKGQYKK